MRLHLVLVLLLLLPSALAGGSTKHTSALYPPEVVAQLRGNIATDSWAASVRDSVLSHAAPWRAMSDEALWRLMFGPTLPRAWMVWSDGYSPVTGEAVPMYNWEMDGLAHPWKVRDPSSGTLFPTNDFGAYYASGLNARGIFEEALADRSLLFNAAHPDPADPLHGFGVDDGHGFVNEKGERWRFIAAYLVYGHWKQLVLGGIRNLSAAYVLSGDPVYAHKAAILLDRVADVYPTFDFKEQGIMYEGPASAGYVSTWHDACEETRELAMAYDMIYPALDDETLVSFLSSKAEASGVDKASPAALRAHIEGGILQDALAHPDKIHSNYPRAEITQAILLRVLQAPEADFWALVDPMLEKATAVDGVTGEKGLAGYSSFTINGLALFLAELSKADPGFVPTLLTRHPRIHAMYRFHIDTFCLGRYYPHIGDSGAFATPVDRYVGMSFVKPGNPGHGSGLSPILAPSCYRLLWELYETTGDVAFAQVLYQANGNRSDGLPYDLFNDDGEAFRRQLDEVIVAHGAEIDLKSVNKEEWRLAILRSGEGKNRRALWIDYDSGGAHGHRDGMNIGLFAHGLDLMPEFGYPPVQFGGWDAPRALWYGKTAAHNTVVVDGKDQPNGAGETALWAQGTMVQAIRASAPALNNGRFYERTVALIDVSEEAFYAVDIFSVAGGFVHRKYQHSHFGTLKTEGLSPAEGPALNPALQMRNLRLDPHAKPGWQARWTIEDRRKLLVSPQPIGMAITDFTEGAAAGTVEGWISAGGFDENDEVWIPRLVVERRAEGGEPLSSNFVAVIEPYTGAGPRLTAKRLQVFRGALPIHAQGDVALAITQEDGQRDLFVLRYPVLDSPIRITLEQGGALETYAELTLLRLDADGTVIYAATAGGSATWNGTALETESL